MGSASAADRVMPPLNEASEMIPFDLSPCIKGILRKRSSNSAPEDDGISYHHSKPTKVTPTAQDSQIIGDKRGVDLEE